MKKTYTGRIEMPDIPERAALECIVSGLIHRDYLDMDYVPSRRRNPVIADIFNRLNYIERRGRGFK